MIQDPAITNSDKYKVIFENDRVRVLEYKDTPGDKTTLHNHPDSFMYTLSSFDRKLVFEDGTDKIVKKDIGDASWLAAQKHLGKNIGSTETHVLLVELKEPSSLAEK